ncbi:MAG: exodeoxyribonuclease VII small subunit [Firmicutes bacterium]|nr:exodeoxyribonuclease VII small subunit [Bacillota bacterium]
MDFEKKLAELEAVVKKLEDKSVSLEDGIALFSSGLNLTKECLASLSESKARITLIREELDKLTESEFKEE